MELANADKLFSSPSLREKLQADSVSVQEDGDFVAIRATKGKKTAGLRLSKVEIVRAMNDFYFMNIERKILRLKAEIA